MFTVYFIMSDGETLGFLGRVDADTRAEALQVARRTWGHMYRYFIE